MSEKIDYIKREDAEKKLKNAFAILVQIDEKGSHNPIIVEASDLLKELPSADVVERRQHSMSIEVLKTEIQTLENILEQERKRGEWIEHESVVPSARPIELHLDVTDDVVDRAVEQIRAESEDCISRADLFEKMQSLCPETDKGCGDCHKVCDIDDCLDFVMNAPSVVPTTDLQTEYTKWETPPKFKNKEIITTCVGVPMALIEDEPTTEQSSKVGEWLWTNERKSQHKCSQCGEVAFAWYSELEDMVEELFDYCPNCGADMRGSDNE